MVLPAVLRQSRAAPQAGKQRSPPPLPAVKILPCLGPRFCSPALTAFPGLSIRRASLQILWSTAEIKKKKVEVKEFIDYKGKRMKKCKETDMLPRQPPTAGVTETKEKK